MSVLIISIVCIGLMISHTSSTPNALPSCNFTNDNLPLQQLGGVLFTVDEPNGTDYLFSLCGMKFDKNDTTYFNPPTNTDQRLPVLVERKIGSSTWNSLAHVDIEGTTFIQKGRSGYLDISSSVPGCVILLSIQCGLTNRMIPVMDRIKSLDTESQRLLLFEVYHPSICSPVLRPRIWAIVVICLVLIPLVVCLIGVAYKRTIRKRSLRDSILRVSILDRVGSSLSNRFKRGRSRRFPHSQTQYIRVPLTPELPTNDALEPKESAPLIRSDPIVNEEDPQDDLLLAL